MSEEELNSFLEKIKGNSGLPEKLKANSDAVVVIAEDGGAISAGNSKREEFRSNEWKTLSAG